MDDQSSHEPRIPSMPKARRGLHVPIEVCERIIDFVDSKGRRLNIYVAKDRRHTLAACALTCRAWRPLSQFHLFNAVFVDDIIRLRRLEGLLCDNAAFAESIVEFTLAEDSRTSYPAWTSQIAFTLRNLPRVQTLSLMYCDWQWLHPTFFILISGIASVTHLHLGNVNCATTRELVLLVFSFPNLCSLSLAYIKCEKVRPYPTISRTSRALPLVNLDFHVDDSSSPGILCILRRLHETSSTEFLQSVSIIGRDNSGSALQDVETLLLSCPSLLSLNIELISDDVVVGMFL